MNCVRCNTQNEDGAKFCKNCGMALSYTPTAAAPVEKSDVLILTAFSGWHFLTYLIFAFLNKVAVPKIIGEGDSTKIASLYKVTDWIVSGIDIAFLLIIVIVLKSKVAKIFFIIFLVIRIGLFVLYKFYNP